MSTGETLNVTLAAQLSHPLIELSYTGNSLDIVRFGGGTSPFILTSDASAGVLSSAFMNVAQYIKLTNNGADSYQATVSLAYSTNGSEYIAINGSNIISLTPSTTVGINDQSSLVDQSGTPQLPVLDDTATYSTVTHLQVNVIVNELP